MRFKRGSRVEVLDKREVPSGSWWCGEIISGNDRYYSIKYDCHSDDTGVTVEKVPRNLIRPCPPPFVCPRCWAAGDIGEVYEKNSWKVVEVLRADGQKYFLVRLLGSSRKLRVHLSYLRTRQVWDDDNWVVIQKKSRECNNRIMNSQSQPVDFSSQMPQPCVEAKTSRGDDHFPNKYDGDFDEPCWVPIGSKKRKPIVTCSGARKKMRAVEETGRHSRLSATPSSHLLEKSGDYQYQLSLRVKMLSSNIEVDLNALRSSEQGLFIYMEYDECRLFACPKERFKLPNRWMGEEIQWGYLCMFLRI